MHTRLHIHHCIHMYIGAYMTAYSSYICMYIQYARIHVDSYSAQVTQKPSNERLHHDQVCHHDYTAITNYNV